METNVNTRAYQNWRFRLLGSLIAGIILSPFIAVSGTGNFWIGWVGVIFLLTLCFFAMSAAWGWAGFGRKLAWMMAAAFFLRLVLGMAFSFALPVYGYDNEYQNAGYPFKDSYYRDTAAWELAQSDRPLWEAFGDDFTADQYGGLSLISAAVYRVISPDAHRPFLILILVSFAAAFSIPFFHQALQHRWDSSVADTAGWILVLYPEGLFYSISQMREPFLIAGIAVAFWAVLSWERSRWRSSVVLGLCLVLLGLISWTVTAGLVVVLAVWFWLEHPSDVSKLLKNIPWWGWVVIALVFLAVLAGLWRWFSTSSAWDWVLVERNSARANLEIERIGEQFRIPFITLMGVAQVVLPAAIAQPSIPLWRGVTIFRSAGWYMLVPFLLYSTLAIWQVRSKQEKRILLWLAAATIGWVLISSARAGGDLWDNPRYRTFFLPWMALLAAWGWQWAKAHKDRWLRRIIMVEGIFLLFFTEWYLARYVSTFFIRLKFWTMVAWILGLSGVVLVGGFLRDRSAARKAKHLKKENVS